MFEALSSSIYIVLLYIAALFDSFKSPAALIPPYPPRNLLLPATIDPLGEAVSCNLRTTPPTQLHCKHLFEGAVYSKSGFYLRVASIAGKYGTLAKEVQFEQATAM